MKPSEITPEVVQNYLRLEETDQDIPMELLLQAAKGFVRGYTGLDNIAMDQHEDITIAILVLCSDLYDNRQMAVDNDKVNRVVQTILDLHCTNLL